MAKQKLMSYRAYSRHRGCALATVQRAIKDGRIEEAVIVQGDKKFINANLADKLWKERTDEARRDNYKGGKNDKKTNPSNDGNDVNVSSGNEGKETGPSYQKNRAIREAYAARMAKLEFEKRSGKLAEVEAVKKYMIKIHSRARDSLLNIPDKLGPKLAAETDIHKIIDILNKEIQNVCDHFSNGDIDF